VSEVIFRCRVFGCPVPQGRPRAFYNKAAGRITMYDPAASRSWKTDIKLQVLKDRPRDLVPALGALILTLTFFLPRPRSLPKRVRHPIRKPDADNLAKAVKDALRGIIYKDDAQVITLHVAKVYHEAPGVEIVLEEVE